MAKKKIVANKSDWTKRAGRRELTESEAAAVESRRIDEEMEAKLRGMRKPVQTIQPTPEQIRRKRAEALRGKATQGIPWLEALGRVLKQ